MENILWTAVVIALFFVCVGIRIILIKDGKFRGSCGSQNVTGDGKCSICGKTDTSGCENSTDDVIKEALQAEAAGKSQ